MARNAALEVKLTETKAFAKMEKLVSDATAIIRHVETEEAKQWMKDFREALGK